MELPAAPQRPTNHELFKDTSEPETRPAASTISYPDEQFARDLVRRKARRLAQGPWFSKSDVDDLEQELSLQIFKATRQFDADLGDWRVFVTAIVERTAAKLVRHHSAQRRRPDAVCSMSQQIVRVDGEPVELGDAIGEDDLDRRHRRSTRSRQELTDLALEVRALLERCSPEERQLCQQLMQDSLSGVARQSNTARSTLCDRVRALQKRFEQTGLKEYL